MFLILRVHAAFREWKEQSSPPSSLPGMAVSIGKARAALQGSFRDHCSVKEVDMACTLYLQTGSLDLKCPL